MRINKKIEVRNKDSKEGSKEDSKRIAMNGTSENAWKMFWCVSTSVDCQTL